MLRCLCSFFLEIFSQVKIRVLEAGSNLKDGDKKIYSKENGNISLTYVVETPSSPPTKKSKMQISVENDDKSFSRLCTINFINDGKPNTTCDYYTETTGELIKSYKDRVEFVYKSHSNIYFKLKQLKASDFGKKYKYNYDYDQFNKQDISVQLVKAGTFM